MQRTDIQVCGCCFPLLDTRLTLHSLCPMNRSVPISADGIIPVDQSDVAGIPPIALTIPDFEGQAILRIFGNSTETEIGCYSAVVTNGATFSHPSSVGTVLGIFTLAALIASFATTVYGSHIPTMRTHYAHSLSIFVVFAVFHHIFFTGALSMNWPSVLASWWSNFAWSAGMIYSESMQNSINQLIGSNKGNTSIVEQQAQDRRLMTSVVVTKSPKSTNEQVLTIYIGDSQSHRKTNSICSGRGTSKNILPKER